MRNAEVIAGLKKMQEGLGEVLSALEAEGSSLPINQPTAEAKKEETTKKTVAAKATVKTPVKEEKAETPAPKKEEKTAKASGSLTREQLDSMTYNALKQKAKELGVPAVGNRDQITDAILAQSGGAPVKEEKATAKTSKATAPTSKDSKVVPMKKKVEKEPEQEETEEEDADDTDEVRTQVEEAVADMKTEEIADLLAEAGISAKGKRQALIDRLVEAVSNGDISFDDDDADAEDAEDAEDSEDADAEGEDEEDDVNDLDNPAMTEERKEAIEDMDKTIRKQIKSKKLKRADMVKYLQEFYQTDEDMSEYADEDLADTYIDARCRMIDDSGEENTEGAYYLNGEVACCGQFVTVDGDSAVCEKCGTEYDL